MRNQHGTACDRRERGTASVAAPQRASSPWIISRREDLLWFHGSVVAGIALLASFLYTARRGDSNAPGVVLIAFLWGALFDGSHVWGTYARSYFAPDEASKAALPTAWSWTLLGVGPIVALLAAWSGDAARFGFFLVSAYLWAYWHLVRQHYGLLMIYRRRAGETNPRAARLDAYLLWVGCLYPFVRFSMTDAYSRSGLPLLLPASLIPAARCVGAGVFAIAAFGLMATVMSQRFEPLRPGPKHLLMGIVIGFHALVFALLGDLLAILATLTIFHNLQYHRIVWLYEGGLGRTPSGGLLPYLCSGVSFGVVWYGVRLLAPAASSSELGRNLFVGLGWGVAFHHYLVDGRIWHVRRSKAVSQALENGAAAS
jgi:hypothetical protein